LLSASDENWSGTIYRRLAAIEPGAGQSAHNRLTERNGVRSTDATNLFGGFSKPDDAESGA